MKFVEPRLPTEQARISALGGFLHGATILVASFLLFLVQPMLAKRITPWLGGSASVWTTCLLFFQAALLGGYLYADALVRVRNRRVQVAIHLSILLASVLFLPLATSDAWKAVAASHPLTAVLSLLMATVGLPYLALSATSPLLQAWYVAVRGAAPYRLYALSNVGSFAALIAYPALVEPRLAIDVQMRMWSAGYALFILLCGSAAYQTTRRVPGRAGASLRRSATGGALVRWTILAATGSALLASVTNALTQDVAPVPLLWILPLAIYLLSFVICFERDRWYSRRLIGWLAPIALVGLPFACNADLSLRLAVLLAALCFFILVILCHGELARSRPPGDELTVFYLAVAGGGAAGSSFVALIAPAIFTTHLELPVALSMCLLVALEGPYRYRSKTFLCAVLAVLLAIVLLGDRVRERNRIWAARNFYGTLRIDEADGRRVLLHGRISHGLQFLDHRSSWPTTYYSPTSGIGALLSLPAPHGHRRAALIGLGIGTLAAYAKPGDTFDAYELNPAVAYAAETYFSFLHGSGAKVTVILGDARLSLEARPPQSYDVIAVDAFSGDAIPIHLLTREACEQYRRHLAPGGVVAFHISNRYLDLGPVVKGLADASGSTAVLIIDRPSEPSSGASPSHWVLVTRNADVLSAPGIRGRETRITRALLWTDDFSNLIAVLR